MTSIATVAWRVANFCAVPVRLRWVVLRRGRVQDSHLPSYEELDDLVSTPTDLSNAQTTVQRGATAATMVHGVSGARR